MIIRFTLRNWGRTVVTGATLTIAGDGYTAYVLGMISQEWRTAKEVDRPIWKHWVTIVRPDRVATDTGLLVVSGGSNESEPPLQANPFFSQLALTTHSVIAEVQVGSGALDAGYNLTDAGAPRCSLFDIDLGKGYGRLRYIGAAIGKAAGAGHFEAAADQQAACSG